MTPDAEELSASNLARLVHELRVHQIEMVIGGRHVIVQLTSIPVVTSFGPAFQCTLEDVSDVRRLDAKLRFGAEVGRLLLPPIDENVALRTVVELAVPSLADVCFVDLVTDHGLSRACESPRGARGTTLQRRVAAIGTGTLYKNDHEEMRAVICVPIRGPDTIHGVLTFGMIGPRTYEPDDFMFAEDVAARLGAAIEFSRVHRRSREASQLLDTMVAHAPVGIGYWDRDRRLVRRNAALAELPPALEQTIDDHLTRVIETGVPALDCEIVDGSANARTWCASFYPIRGWNGLAGVAAIVVDVTKQKRAACGSPPRRAGSSRRRSNPLRSWLGWRCSPRPISRRTAFSTSPAKP